MSGGKDEAASVCGLKFAIANNPVLSVAYQFEKKAWSSVDIQPKTIVGVGGLFNGPAWP